MGSIDMGTEYAHLNDVLGQMLMLRIYTQVSLFFDNEDGRTLSEITKDLKRALAELAKAFPWLSGQVVINGKTDTNAGVAQIISCDEEISLIVGDIRDDAEMPSMSILRETKFPSRLLHREKIASPPAAGESYEQIKDGPARILVLQLTAIDGGFVLTFAGVHHFMDMNGLGQIIYLFSKACQAEPFTEREIELGNCSRRELIPLLDSDFVPGPDFEHLVLKAKSNEPAAVEPVVPPVVAWTYFAFDAERLRLLKAEAAKQEITDYISTNDALTALLYQRMQKVRVDRSPELGHSVMFRCVDGRKMFGVDKEYLGHMVAGTWHFEPDVYQLPLAEVTGRLRKEMLDEPRNIQTMRALVTLFDRASDKSTVSYLPNFNPSKDIMMSSWAKVPCYDSKFGLLGKPESVRRARLAPWEGLIYFMPKARDGEIAAAVCLREDDIEALRRDEEFMRYATYIG